MGDLNFDSFWWLTELEKICEQRGIPVPRPGARYETLGWIRSKCERCGQRDWNWRGIKRKAVFTDRYDELTRLIQRNTLEEFYCHECRVSIEFREAVAEE